MNRAATLLLLLAATVAVVLVLTTEQFRTSPEWKLQPGSQMFDPDEEKISEIRLQNGERSVVLVKRGDRWVFAGAVEDDASPEAVRAIFRAAAETMVFDRIDGEELSDEKSRAAYGVLKSGVMFDFNSDRPHRLFFGKTAADPSRVYASFQGSDTVYLVSDDLMRFAMLPPDAFRDRRVVPFDPEKVKAVTIRDKASVVTLQRDGESWRITRPISAAADPAAVGEFLSALLRLRFEEFGTGKPGEGGSAEELENEFEIRVSEIGREGAWVASFGAPSQEEKVVGRLEPRGVWVLLDTDALRAVAPDLDSLRDRVVLRTNPDLIDLVRLGGGIELRRGKDDARINDIAKMLQSLKAVRFQAATPSALEAAGLGEGAGSLELLSVLSENTPEAPAGEHPVAVFKIGSDQPDGTVPLHAQGAAEILFVPATFRDALAKP